MDNTKSGTLLNNIYIMKFTYPAPFHDWLHYTHVFIKTTLAMDLFLRVSHLQKSLSKSLCLLKTNILQLKNKNKLLTDP